jgi:hypothetical protein
MQPLADRGARAPSALLPLLFALALGACHSLRPITSLDSLPADRRAEVRVTTRDGRRLALSDLHVTKDSLVGREFESGVPGVGVAIADVAWVELVQSEPEMSAVVTVVVLMGATIGLLALLAYKLGNIPL